MFGWFGEIGLSKGVWMGYGYGYGDSDSELPVPYVTLDRKGYLIICFFFLFD